MKTLRRQRQRNAVYYQSMRNALTRRKLTIEQAVEIRTLYNEGRIAQNALAERYNVSIHIINKIVNYQSYLLAKEL